MMAFTIIAEAIAHQETQITLVLPLHTVNFPFCLYYIIILIFLILFLKLVFVVPPSLIALNAQTPLPVQLVSRTFSKAALDSVSYVM
jgi:hypothetical protein